MQADGRHLGRQVLMSTLSLPASRSRPVAVTAAVVLSALIVLANLAGPLLPAGSGDDKVPTFVIILGVVLGVIGIVAAVALWQLRRWGMILTVIISIVNLLSSAPGIVAGPNTGIKILAGAGVLVSAAVIVLALMPEARRAYR
jgi:uncharacterized membrane protein (UPF0136 family)